MIKPKLGYKYEVHISWHVKDVYYRVCHLVSAYIIWHIKVTIYSITNINRMLQMATCSRGVMVLSITILIKWPKISQLKKWPFYHIKTHIYVAFLKKAV